MNKFIFVILISLAACDSPMNHRVRTHDQDQQNFEQSLSFKRSKLSLTAQWIKGPNGNIKSLSELLVFIEDSNGNRVNIPKEMSLNFYATMPSMGHAMEDAGFFEQIETGIYLNKSIRFNMPGDWKMELWLMDKDFEIKDKVQWPEFL